MATTLTLAQLRTAAQQRADQVNSTFVSDAEWTSYLNASAFELYDLLVAAYGADYYATTYSLTTDGTSDTYALPAGLFYKLLGVDVQITGAAPTGYVTLLPFNFMERNRWAAPNVLTVTGATNLRYRLNGDTLWLVPRASAGQTVRLWYVPRYIPMSGESDTFDGISGWTEYVIVDAAIKAMQKEESDCSLLMAQKGHLVKRIEGMAQSRDLGAPPTVADVSRANAGGWPGDGWGL